MNTVEGGEGNKTVWAGVHSLVHRGAGKTKGRSVDVVRETKEELLGKCSPPLMSKPATDGKRKNGRKIDHKKIEGPRVKKKAHIPSGQKGEHLRGEKGGTREGVGKELEEGGGAVIDVGGMVGDWGWRRGGGRVGGEMEEGGREREEDKRDWGNGAGSMGWGRGGGTGRGSRKGTIMKKGGMGMMERGGGRGVGGEEGGGEGERKRKEW